MGPLPDILEQHVIPMQLHGLNPRTLMGKAAWDKTRRAAYAKHGYRCAACGVRKSDAEFFNRLEAHERYEIDHARKIMTVMDIEPLCHACHAFVHSGLMRINLHKGLMKKQKAIRILEHGVDVLTRAGLSIPEHAAFMCASLGVGHSLTVKRQPRETSWSGWKLVWDGKEYASPYPSYAAWQKDMSKRKTSA